jgi:hypothetical protein
MVGSCFQRSGERLREAMFAVEGYIKSYTCHSTRLPQHPAPRFRADRESQQPPNRGGVNPGCWFWARGKRVRLLTRNQEKGREWERKVKSTAMYPRAEA